MTTDRLQAGPAPASGNGVILDVRKRSGAWIVRFLSEPRTSPEPLWFHIECSGVGGALVHFVWENASGCLGLHDPAALEHVRPVVRHDDGPWHRVEGVALKRLPQGGHAVSFEATGGNVRTAAAFCYPYVQADLEETLREIGPPWRRHVLGLTTGGRPLLRLEAPSAGRGRKGPAAYILARQHAGETPGSWVLDGLLRAVAAERRSGRLRRISWWVVPFMNLDGVVAGDYGKDSQPVDFNRSWSPVTMRPEVLAVQRDMARFAAKADRRLVLDLHAPAGGERQFYQFVANPTRPEKQQAAQRKCAAMLARQFPDLEPRTLIRQSGDPSRWPSRWNGDHTVCNWTWDHLDGTLGVTIETTYLSIGDGPFLGTDGYRGLGRKVARTAADWLLSASDARPA
jgi:hypothetical protein